VAASDTRLIALSDASRHVLARVLAWPADFASPIHRIHVSQRGQFGRTVIDRSDYGLDALGHVVPYGELARVLAAQLQRRGIEVIRPARIAQSKAYADRIVIERSDGEKTETAYVIHAEGGLFDQQDPKAIRRDYEQMAVTAFVTVGRPQSGVAWERFTSDGPLALLPARVGHESGLALVWCSKAEDAARRLVEDEPAFLAELHEVFGDRLGGFLSVRARASFALGLNAVEEPARPREFAIGNAAQTLHPVAGQGLNLGLRDAQSVARLLVEHFDAPRTCMELFRAARRKDRAATINLTDFLPRVFGSRLFPIETMRSAALTFLDLVGPARHVLARQMMEGQRS
jgi:2-octaprenyl-6-methoxyphenol hydroxylase